MRKRIMVIDDNLTSLTQIKSILSKEHDVLPATSGAQALKLLQKFTPDIILLDIIMPEMDGFETLLALRHVGVTCDIYILTGAEEADGLREKCIEAGAKGYLRKPLTAPMLMAIASGKDFGSPLSIEPDYM